MPPAPGSVLLRLLDALIGLLNDGSASGGPQWPDWLPVADDVDTTQLGRRLRGRGLGLPLHRWRVPGR